MPVKHLAFTDVGPFREVALSFDPQTNVLTGPNNSGKSSVLFVLGEILVYPFSVPTKLLRSDSPTWELALTTGQGDQEIEGTFPTEVEKLASLYENLGYTCFVPAQRLGASFRSQGPSVGEDLDSRLEQELDAFERSSPLLVRQAGRSSLRDTWRQYLGTETPSLQTMRRMPLTDPYSVSDKDIIQKIVNLDYFSYRNNRVEAREAVNRVIAVASEIAEGFPIDFAGVGEDEVGLYPQIESLDGNLPLDVLSQGTQSLIHWLARFLLGYAEYYDFSSDFMEKPAILMIDEVDAHLHPSWQRRIIPTLNKHFPKVQVICSTHSPLMLAGLGPGQVQLLGRGEDGTVTASTNARDIKGWSADEILRQFLDLDSPTDLETVEEINRLQALRQRDVLGEDERVELEQLRRTVGRISQTQQSELLEKLGEILGAGDEADRGGSGARGGREKGSQADRPD